MWKTRSAPSSRASPGFSRQAAREAGRGGVAQQGLKGNTLGNKGDAIFVYVVALVLRLGETHYIDRMGGGPTPPSCCRTVGRDASLQTQLRGVCRPPASPQTENNRLLRPGPSALTVSKAALSGGTQALLPLPPSPSPTPPHPASRVDCPTRPT